MFDGSPVQWDKPASQTRNTTDEAAFVFLGIFLAVLTVPAAVLVWAIAQGLMAVLS